MKTKTTKSKQLSVYDSNFLFDFIFEQTKLVAKEFYFTILAKWDPIVPAFKEKVEISHIGWDHLHEKVRSKFDNLARYFALPKIIPLLKNKNIKPKHEKGRDKKTKIEFWSFVGTIDGVIIKIVLRSINKGRKHLYSIMWRGEVKEEQKNRSCLSHVKRTRGMVTPQLQSLFTKFLVSCQPLSLKNFFKKNRIKQLVQSVKNVK